MVPNYKEPAEPCHNFKPSKNKGPARNCKEPAESESHNFKPTTTSVVQETAKNLLSQNHNFKPTTTSALQENYDMFTYCETILGLYSVLC